MNATLRRTLAKKTKIPEDEVDKYFKLALRYLGLPRPEENLVLVIATMKALFRTRRNRS